MTISLSRDDHRRWLIAQAEGELTIEEVIHFLQTARASDDARAWPLLFDTRGATTSMVADDVDRVVDVVRSLAATGIERAHVAIVAAEDRLFAWLLLYEAKCEAIGVRVIRIFRQRKDAERWLDIMSASPGALRSPRL
jgi:hypothetical protein